MNSGIRIRGRAVIEVHDVRTGELLKRSAADNLVVNGGLAALAALIADPSSGVYPLYMGASASSTAITATDTTLSGEFDRVGLGTTTSAAAVVTFRAMWGKDDENGSTFRSYALFDQASSGTMFSAFVDSSDTDKDSTKSITVTYTWTLSDA